VEDNPIAMLELKLQEPNYPKDSGYCTTSNPIWLLAVLDFPYEEACQPLLLSQKIGNIYSAAFSGSGAS
jgi:hypothetical protein